MVRVPLLPFHSQFNPGQKKTLDSLWSGSYGVKETRLSYYYPSLFIQVHRLRVQHGVGEAQPPALQAFDRQGPDREPRTLLQQAAQRLPALLRHPHRRDQDLHHRTGVREDEVSRGPSIRLPRQTE